VLSETQVSELAKAAASGIEIQASQIIGVDVLAAKIKVEDLAGTTLSGKNITHPEGKWELRSDGSAKLGNGGIEISSDGTVTFGPNVNMS
jgi:hypothetical protein